MMPPIGRRARAAVTEAAAVDGLAPLLAAAVPTDPALPLCGAAEALRVGRGTELIVGRLLPGGPPAVPGADTPGTALALLALSRLAAGRLAVGVPGPDTAALSALEGLRRTAPDLLDELVLATALSLRGAPAPWEATAAALAAAAPALAALDLDPQPPPAAGALSAAWQRLRGTRVGQPGRALRVAIARGLVARPR